MRAQSELKLNDYLLKQTAFEFIIQVCRMLIEAFEAVYVTRGLIVDLFCVLTRRSCGNEFQTRRTLKGDEAIRSCER